VINVDVAHREMAIVSMHDMLRRRPMKRTGTARWKEKDETGEIYSGSIKHQRLPAEHHDLRGKRSG